MINVDKVYQRVLLLANKDQRGYITPIEFNSYAEQATNEIQSMYSFKMFQVGQGPDTDSDYGDAMKVMEEKISYHDTLETIASDTDFYPYPASFFQLGVVIVNDVIADEVSHKEAVYVNLSPLTKTTRTQPIYTRHSQIIDGVKTEGITVHPKGEDNAVQINFLKKAGPGVWAYMTSEDGTPVYDAANSTDFDLHPSEEHDLVYKILVLAGVTIKAPDIAGFGQSKEQQIAQTEI